MRNVMGMGILVGLLLAGCAMQSSTPREPEKKGWPPATVEQTKAAFLKYHRCLEARARTVDVHTPEPLVHRMPVIYEAAGLKDGFQAYIVRSLLSEGHIKYHLPNRIITKQGPTGLLVTTTADSLHRK